MKKPSKTNSMKSEYDFSAMQGGVRGKYVKQYQAGSNIVVLADDVANAFPTDESVNRALRAVMDAARAMPTGVALSGRRVQPTKVRNRAKSSAAKR